MRMFRTFTGMDLVVRRSLGPNGCEVKLRNPRFSAPPTRPTHRQCSKSHSLTTFSFLHFQPSQPSILEITVAKTTCHHAYQNYVSFRTRRLFQAGEESAV
jgi:hypothetical protein